MTATWPVNVMASLLGLTVGSFLNVVISRLPAAESLSRPRSRCPRCASPITPRDNVPVLSWLVLRGRCRTCREPIAARYPAVEAVTGVLFGLAAARYHLGWDAVTSAALSAGAVAAAGIAIEGHTVPARVPLVTVAGFALAWLGWPHLALGVALGVALAAALAGVARLPLAAGVAAAVVVASLLPL